MLIAIIVVNVAVFLVMAITTGEVAWSARELLEWGGNFGLWSLNGQWWRLFTATYLHANLMHIAGNMFLLAIAGQLVLARVGPTRFVLAYTVCGLAASALSAWTHPTIVSIGASGAIAGVVGILVILFLSGRCPEISGAWVAQTVGINAVYSFAPNVDWTAHAGGFLAGLVCGVALLTQPLLPGPWAQEGDG